MPSMRLGGVKVFENRAYLCSSCRSGADALGSICSFLAAGRINSGLLTYMADNGLGQSIVAASTKGAGNLSGYIDEGLHPGECEILDIEREVCRISIFPHDQRPEITGSLVAVLDVNAIMPCAFASSPSAVTVVVCSSDFQVMMEKLFGAFSFPDCGSYREWHAVRRMDEQRLSEVRCSYSEDIITIYGITRQTGLDLWDLFLPIEHMGWFGAFLSGLGELDFKLPFLVSNSAPRGKGIHFSFALRADRQEGGAALISIRRAAVIPAAAPCRRFLFTARILATATE